VFPISNWTELDVWQYVARERLELPSIYFAHEREVFRRDGMLYAASEFVERYPTRSRSRDRALPDGRRHDVHRRRALGRGDARRGRRRDRGHDVTERGETRADDRVSEAAMEDRKRVGYF
jgi:sulfate adenylyltransferase subunit 2